MLLQINIDTNAPVEDIARVIALSRKPEEGMTMDEYQTLAERTICEDLLPHEIESHALHGMSSEIGEIHGLYQKVYQGHQIDSEHLKKEIGDLLWFVSEYCTANGWSLEEVARLNIEKLKARYPDGFEAQRSLNRKECDI